ncbi:DUF2157 domain-containing protein [Marinicella sp. W31]|uniref:DUF2157 domain-containing protein n=1 Tax=Marinicella sp. W31 TaxID=3023713 RepID=UPI0037573ED5
MNKMREQILQWAEQGAVKVDQLDQALSLVDAQPQAQAWFGFIGRLLLWLGALSTVFGVIFFFAYNWDDLHRWHKFAVVQSILVLASVWAWYSRHRAITVIALTVVAVLTGAGLALFGQTYQTGADPWQLFAIWAVLITPLALLSASAVLWLLWLLLIHTAVFLGLQYFHWFWGFLGGHSSVLWVMFIINGLSAVFFESIGDRTKAFKVVGITISMKHRLMAQVTVLLALTATTWLAFYALFDGNSRAFAGFPVYLLSIAVVFYLYQSWKRDLLLLAGAVFSAVFVIVCSVARGIGDAFSEGGLLLIAFLIIVLSTAGGIWLKNVAQAWSKEDEVNE